eukprot:gene14499-16006_t
MADSNDDFIRGETLDVVLDLLDEELLDEMFQDGINVALEDINVQEKTSASFSCETCRKYYKTKGGLNRHTRKKHSLLSDLNEDNERATDLTPAVIVDLVEKSKDELLQNSCYPKFMRDVIADYQFQLSEGLRSELEISSKNMLMEKNFILFSTANYEECNSSLRKYALKTTDITLKDILLKGKSNEISKQQANEMENAFPTTTSDMQAMHIRSAAPKLPRKSNFQPKGETHKKQTKKTCYNCGVDFPHQHGPCPAQGKTCSYCNRKNHFTRCCKQRAKKQEQKVHTVATKESNTSSDESSDQYVYCMENKMENTKKLQSALIIKGQKVLFLVDKGASVNIMDENSFNKINRKTGTPIKLKQSKVRVYAYGSKTPLEMMGEFEETIETNQRITLAKFHVAREPPQLNNS